MVFLQRILRYGWQSFRRNVLVSTAAISVLIITLSLVTGVVLFNALSEKVINALRDKISVGVYFSTNAQENKILQLKKVLEETPGVKSVEYVSRQEALKRFRDAHKDDNTINEALDKLGGQNPLPASLSVKAVRTEDYPTIVKSVESSEYNLLVEEIDYTKRQDAIENLGKFSKNVNQAALMLAIVMGIIALLVSFNTLQLAIYNDRQKIGIMRLVGASNNFVRGPFIIQGGIYGIVSAFLTLFLVTIILQLVNGRVEDYFRGLGPLNIANYYASHWFYFLGIQLLFGICVGVASSLIAIRRHLKV